MKTALLVAAAMAVAVALLIPQDAQAAKITNDGETIFYEGKVKRGDAKRLREMVEKTLIHEINLDSGGGNALEGFDLGHLFKLFNMNATVDKGNRCLSSCANAFLGAPTNDLKGLLGFHVAWSSGKGSVSDGMRQGQQYGVLTTLYTFKMGYRLQLQYIISMYTDADTMLMLGTEDLTLFKMKDNTDFVEGHDFPNGWLAERIAGPTRLYLLRMDE